MNRLSKITGVLLLLVLAACSGGGGTETTGTENDTITNDPTPTIEVIDQTTGNVAQVAEPTATLDMGDDAESEETGLPRTDDGEEILARVNGEVITRTAFDQEYARRLAASAAADPNALAINVMDTMIEQTVIRQAAETLGVNVTPEELDAEIAENRALVGGDEAWANWLALNGYTMEEYRNDILPNSLLTFRIIDAVTNVPEVVPQVNARHILVNTEVEAEGILERLQAGEDFATLAAQYSNDLTTRDQGGDLGWFIPETLTTPELADVALELEPGQVAGPVVTQLGYHIIQTIDVGERPPEPEEEALLIESQFRRWLDEQIAQAVIERYLY